MEVSWEMLYMEPRVNLLFCSLNLSRTSRVKESKCGRESIEDYMGGKGREPWRMREER